MRTGVMCPKGIICQLCNRNRNLLQNRGASPWNKYKYHQLNGDDHNFIDEKHSIELGDMRSG